MGKISVLTKEQKIILDLVSRNDYLSHQFYFTGETALSYFYLQHRFSENLDFFSEEKFDNEIVFSLISKWSKIYHFTFTSRFVEIVYRFNLNFENKANFKIDFAYFPHKKVERGGKINSMVVDSLKDIAVNKLLTINQRTDVKDFVDLYFLLNEKFNVWELLYAAEVKFKETDFDLLILSEDFLKVDDFTNLPAMIKPLTLKKLKKFFHQKAKELAGKVVIP